MNARVNWFRRAAARLSLPLLARELTEQAAQRRTYVLRVVYGLLLFGLVLLMAGVTSRQWARHARTYDPMALVGIGQSLFYLLVALQFAGTFVLLPAMMCGAIAREKETGSLPLLFMTDLRPWELLLQKYVSRLIPLFTCLLLSVPLMAIAYAYGGMEPGMLARAAWWLFITALQVGAIALFASALARGTGSAFITAYALGAAFYFALPVTAVLLDATTDWRGWINDSDVVFAFVGPYLFFDNSSDDLSDTLWHSLPVVGSTLVFLLAARVTLTRRAFRHAPGLVARFRRLDGLLLAINRRVGGIVVAHDREPLPDGEPVAWRERNRRGLGKPNHLVRITLALEIPALLGIAVFAPHHTSRSDFLLSGLMFVVWAISLLFVTVHAASLIASERSDQTLDVLLTTPLSAEDIVKQKMTAMRRLIGVAAVPLLTVMVTEACCEAVNNRHVGRSMEPILYIVRSLVCMALFLPLAAWMALWVGLRVRNRLRATMTAAALVAFLFVGAPLLWVFAWEAVIPSYTRHRGHHLAELACLFPGGAVAMNEAAPKHPWGPLLPYLVSFALSAGVLWIVRRRCLDRAAPVLRGEPAAIWER